MKENLFSWKQILFTIISIFAFNTSSAQINFSQNFNSSASFPTGWVASSGYSNSTSNACDGRSPRGGLASTLPTNTLTSPNQSGSNGLAINVNFNYKILNSAGGTAAATNFGSIQVQYSTNNGSSFTTAYTINNTNHISSTSCAPVSFTIPSGTIPNGSSFMLRFAGTWANGSFYIHIDDVAVNQITATPPNCNATLIAPANGSVDVPITTSTLTWSAATGIPTGYRLRVGTTPGGAEVINNVDAGNVTSYAISLVYNTTYYVGITPYNANGNATGCTEYSFTTAAPVTTTVPWEEEFNTTSLPNGWINNGFNIARSTRLPDAETNVIFKNLNASNTTGNFRTISAGEIQSGDILSFVYRLGVATPAPYNPPAAGSGDFIVSVSTDYGLSYSDVQSINNNGLAGWQDYSFDLSPYEGEYVKIKITANRISEDYFIGFDNFYIGQPITCESPENLVLNYAADDTARISWDAAANASNYSWYIFAPGANPDTASPLANGTVSTSYVDLVNLTASTEYDFYVKSDCGVTDGMSVFSEKLNFTTQCEAIVDFPFTETFENDSPYLDCWNSEYVTGSTDWTTYTGAVGGNVTSAHSGTQNALFYFASYAQNKTKLVSPSFDLSNMTDPKLTFWYANQEGFEPDNQNELKVYYKTSSGDSWILIPGATYNSNINVWTYVELSLPQISDDYYIAFEGTNNYGSGIVIDDITVDDFFTCPETIWDGIAWSNGLPDVDKKAIINGNLVLNSNLVACELEVTANGSLEIASGFSFTVKGLISNYAAAADFLVANEGNLIQQQNMNNIGEITVNRDSQPFKRLDYTMWSSPVIAQNLFNFSPNTVNGVTNYPGSTGRIYIYDGDNQYVNPQPFTANSIFEQAEGYLFRAPNNWDATIPTAYNGVFTGIPFNGNVSISTNANNFTSIGNPYPSNINADLLMSANTGIATLYYWNNTGVAGSNYATYTALGGAAAGGGSAVPDEFISVGQGFIVATTDAFVSFDNTMRVGNAANFFKGNEIEKHRFWLNLKNQNNEKYNQILLGYMTGATNEADYQIDGKQFGYEGSALYSLINEENYSVQGRALPFEDSDVIKLGFKATETGRFNISLANFDGLFTEGDVKIYLKDKQTNTLHNLMESDYDFESEAGAFNERFEIVYKQDEVMGTGDLTATSVQIYKHNQNIVVDSKKQKIISVELFDLAGRNIFRNEKVNANHYEFTSLSKGVLIVRVQTQNGELVTKRVINK